jgi:hypothetical protein
MKVCSKYIEYSDVKGITSAGSMAQVVQHLPSMLKALGSIPSTGGVGGYNF